MLVIKRTIVTGKTEPRSRFESWWTGHSFGAKRFRKVFEPKETAEQLEEVQHWTDETENDENGERLVNYRRMYYEIIVEEFKDEQDSPQVN